MLDTGMTESIIKPKRPIGEGWFRWPDPPSWVTYGYDAETWLHESKLLTVISAVVVAYEDGIYKGPEYHVSMSKNGLGRCSGNEAKFVIKEFDMQDAEEDNHVGKGIVRNFWKTVAEKLIGRECPCKESEPEIIEDKGDYVWRGIKP